MVTVLPSSALALGNFAASSAKITATANPATKSTRMFVSPHPGRGLTRMEHNMNKALLQVVPKGQAVARLSSGPEMLRKMLHGQARRDDRHRSPGRAGLRGARRRLFQFRFRSR